MGVCVSAGMTVAAEGWLDAQAMHAASVALLQSHAGTSLLLYRAQNATYCMSHNQKTSADHTGSGRCLCMAWQGSNCCSYQHLLRHLPAGSM
jgi:hypothetical protein